MKRHSAFRSIEALESRIAPAVIFAVEADTNKLVSFDSATPGTLLGDVTITGLQPNEIIAGIDFRASTGELYGFGYVDTGAALTGRIYKIDPVTAVATLLSGTPFSTTLDDTAHWGMEFLPGSNSIHLVSDLDQNITINGDSWSQAGNGTDLNDPAADEQVVAIAYSKPFGSNANTLYGYNYQNDNLVIIGGLDGTPTASTGTVASIAHFKLNGVNFLTDSRSVGFDISSEYGGPDVGFLSAKRTGNGGSNFYQVDLATAALTDLGAIGSGTRLFGGLAVQPYGPVPVISTDGKTATWTDIDGDAVTLKITKGALTEDLFRMLAGPGETSALSRLKLSGAAFTGTNITISAKIGPNGGDGMVNVGAIDADGVDLGVVRIGGDIQKISAGADGGPLSLKSLSATSFARYGLNLLPGSDAGASVIRDGFGTFTVKGDFSGCLDLKAGNYGSILIGGSLLGGERFISGAIDSSVAGANVGKILIKGGVIGGSGNKSGLINVEAKVVTIGGSMIGGGGTFAGSMFVRTGANITIGDSILGGSGSASGLVSVQGPSTIKVRGNLEGGSGDGAGQISGGTQTSFFKSIYIGGSILGHGLNAGINATRAGSIVIKGSVVGTPEVPVYLTFGGDNTPSTTAESVAVNKISIGGSIEHAFIQAGVAGSSGFIVTRDAAIGSIKIGRDMIASSITAGIDLVNGIAGDANDKFVNSVENPAIIARIASVTIGGQLLGTVGGLPDSFGIIAEDIGRITVGKTKLPLTANKDDFFAGFTGDVRVRELS